MTPRTQRNSETRGGFYGIRVQLLSDFKATTYLCVFGDLCGFRPLFSMCFASHVAQETTMPAGARNFKARQLGLLMGFTQIRRARMGVAGRDEEPLLARRVSGADGRAELGT